MVKLIVYDLDGTLVNTRRDIAEAANHMRRRMGLGALSEKEIAGYVGLGVQRLVENCLGTADPSRVKEGMDLYRTHYAEHLLDNTALYPGVQEVLDYFRPRRQAVITNKPSPYSQKILESLGVAPYFSEIIAGDSGYPKKPDPDSLMALMIREGVKGYDTVLVGDSPVDVETGSRAGVCTVAVTQGFSERGDLEQSKPDHLIGDFRDLLSLAQKRTW